MPWIGKNAFCVLLSYTLPSICKNIESIAMKNATVCSICTDEPQVATKNIKLLSVTMETQKMGSLCTVVKLQNISYCCQ
jgi:glucosamine 6-phosphate synthetase-like amidotransferase/phosphosugar isomerase protein